MVLYKTSVGQIINLLFYGEKYQPPSNVYESGSVLHYRLGFTGSEKFCRYISLDDIVKDSYLRLCGIPDRVSLEDKLYVDELKTTYSNKKDFAYNVGYHQLQLYMYLTGIYNGRVYVYTKDSTTLEHRKYGYEKKVIYELIRTYMNIILEREKYSTKTQ